MSQTSALDAVMNDRDAHAPWRELAACRGRTELFFPADGQETFPWAYDRARQICRACPVFTECYRWAIGSGLPNGFIAGMTPRERDRHAR